MSGDDQDLAIGFLEAPVALALSRHRIIQACNGAFALLFGHAADALIGRSLVQIYPSVDTFADVVDRWMAPLRDRGQFVDERFMRRSDGELFWCRVAGRTLTPADPLARAVWSFTELPTPAHLDGALSRRERDVACHVARGRTSKEIAKLMGLSPRTVEGHRLRLMRKLKVRNAAELNARIKGGLG
ncbi:MULTISPECIES: helix-turn-helix domain-containing protein [unclassified Xanthobacter]|uniref:helix-turn-helix domain-containing protein n=1 Tax=unclassified Xanthobacter TaxID=2623496 RepID=UPI001EE047AC|nr:MULTISPECIES: helix-turn-helix transcriptional regulator [unclassified Xanthobacter]